MAQSRADDGGSPRVVLVGRAGCHLCDDARVVVADVAARTGTAWTEVSVDDDPDLLSRYGDLVPVVLVDSAEVAHHRVSPEALVAALADPADARPPWLRRWWRGDAG